MHSFFDANAAQRFQQRLAQLRSDSPRQWGKMSAPQMVAHLSKGMEQAMGDIRPPRMFIGRLLGGFIKSKALADDEPMRRDSPTVPGFVISDERDLNAEREKLNALIDRAVEAGPSVCTSHPHSFFGKLTPNEWGILMYKHLDHHLRQFGV